GRAYREPRAVPPPPEPVAHARRAEKREGQQRQDQCEPGGQLRRANPSPRTIVSRYVPGLPLLESTPSPILRGPFWNVRRQRASARDHSWSATAGKRDRRCPT